MTRVRLISLGVLVLLLALLPFVPRGGGDDGDGEARRAAAPAVRTAGPALTAGYGRVTPAYRRTIARVVDAGQSSGRIAATASPRTLVAQTVRCATFEGQRYCLGQGWTRLTEAQVQRRTTALVARRSAKPATRQTTGDLSTLDAVRQTARMSPRARASAETAELTEAARSVAKVWLLRHEIQGVPLPPHFRALHPEVRAVTTTTTNGRAVPAGTTSRSAKHWRDYPDRAVVLNRHHVTEQRRTYWCGPTSMQMITWGWSGEARSQHHWATKLGTTTSGSAITSMVSVVNRYTGYDKQSYAGPYITLDISDWSFRQWRLLMARHIVDYRAPVVLHPVLLTQFYPYLDHDGSGHFQVGRGYQKKGDHTPLLGYFEPWNQQRFHPDEPYIPRVQWRNAYRSYRANRAHFQHNVGV
jgi:hypothetical protein